MDNKMTEVISDVILVMSKITEHKLNGSNYLDWSTTIRLYLRSIDKDNHMTNDPPKDGFKTGMAEGGCPIILADTELY